MSATLNSPSRRNFIKGVTASGLQVAVGHPLAAIAAPHPPTPNVSVNSWVQIAPDGAVTLLSNTSELGQGTGTALAQILANELDLDWRTIHIEMAPIKPVFFNGEWGEYATYGSGGVSGQIAALRLAGAQARAMLISAAATKWKVAASDCDTAAGKVLHPKSGRRIAYGQLALAAGKLPIPANAVPMPKERWGFIGKDIPRLDLPDKVNGSARYGVDVHLPGMLIATILQSPRFGGQLASVDQAPAMAIRGVRRVIEMDDAVAVVANSYWAAKKGLDALSPIWDNAKASQGSSPAYMKALLEDVKSGGQAVAPGKSTAAKVIAAYNEATSKAAQTLESIYTVPFLAHATMEPMNATALVSANAAELWLPTQNQSAALAAVAQELTMSPDAVTIHTTLSGGGFGRRIEVDFVLQAVRIAKRIDAPVKLIWSREEDIRHDFYRPAAAVKLTAGVGDDGLPLALRFASSCESLLHYSGGGASKAASKPVDPSAIGESPSYYQIPAVVLAANTIDIGVPVGYWRSVAASQNTFAYESFIDELAHLAKIDPVAYRRSLLIKDGRERRALDVAIERSGWNEPLTRGRSRGVALVRANRSVVVHVVELSVENSGEVNIHRITTAVDCGIAVNPRNIRAQIEGGIAFGLSAAFFGEITIRDGAVEQSNFHDYRLITLANMPPVDVIILESDEKPGGVGEEAVSPIAPAVANALFAATGKRIRSLPFSKAGFIFS